MEPHRNPPKCAAPRSQITVSAMLIDQPDPAGIVTEADELPPDEVTRLRERRRLRPAGRKRVQRRQRVGELCAVDLGDQRLDLGVLLLALGELAVRTPARIGALFLLQGIELRLRLVGAGAGLLLGIVIGHGLVELVSRTINDLYFVVAVKETVLPASSVAKALLAYYELGASSLLIRGYEPLEDAERYGAELIPIVRRLVAEEDDNSSRPSNRVGRPSLSGAVRN